MAVLLLLFCSVLFAWCGVWFWVRWVRCRVWWISSAFRSLLRSCLAGGANCYPFGNLVVLRAFFFFLIFLLLFWCWICVGILSSVGTWFSLDVFMLIFCTHDHRLSAHSFCYDHWSGGFWLIRHLPFLFWIRFLCWKQWSLWFMSLAWNLRVLFSVIKVANLFYALELSFFFLVRNW